MRIVDGSVVGKRLGGLTEKKSKATEIAARAARLEKAGLLLGEDELVERGQAQAISDVAVPDMQFTLRFEQILTVYLAVSNANLTKPVPVILLT